MRQRAVYHITISAGDGSHLEVVSPRAAAEQRFIAYRDQAVADGWRLAGGETRRDGRHVRLLREVDGATQVMDLQLRRVPARPIDPALRDAMMQLQHLARQMSLSADVGDSATVARLAPELAQRAAAVVGLAAAPAAAAPSGGAAL